MKVDSPLLWLLGILLTGFVGWWFRDREAKKALRLKDLRSKIDLAAEELDDIEDLSVSYFLKPGSDESIQEDGLKIKAKLRRIGTYVNAIHKEINISATQRNPSLLTKLKNHRQAVTLEDFESAERPALKAKDAKFEKISKASSELKEALENAYEAQK